MSDATARAAPTATAIPGVEDLAAWLSGSWDVERTINDGQGRFTGCAAFAPDGDGGVDWRESGRLALDGHEGQVYRNLRVSPAPDGTWEVRFDDGRPFHALDLRCDRCEAEHVCGPDVYRGTYEVLDGDRMTVCWRVTGPGREDLIASEYRRSKRLAAPQSASAIRGASRLNTQ